MHLIPNNIIKGFVFIFIISLFSCLSMFEEQQNTANLLPSDTELYTWELVKSKTINDQQSITMLVPSFYQHYNVIELVTGKYESINDPAISLTVTIARTSNADDAYGLFTRERALLNDTFEIDTVTAYSKNKSIAYIDNIIIIVQTNDIDFIKTQKTTISIILDKVRSNQQLPDVMNPVTKLINESNIVIYNEGIPELPDIKHIIVGNKTIDSSEISCFYKKYFSSLDAGNSFNSLIKNDSSLMIVESSKVKIAFKKYGDSYCYVAHSKEWIFGCKDIKDYAAGIKVISILYRELVAQ